MLSNQKHLFNLAEDTIYLNGSYMSPQLKSVERIGIMNLRKKSTPTQITPEDFFQEKEILKSRFATLIGAANPQYISITPSVSYGIASVINNIPFHKGDEIVVLEEQFPSNYYSWKQLEKEQGVIIKTITAPGIVANRGALWNQKILDAISENTKAVALPQVHWADGTLFDLKTIREKTNLNNGYLIIDGTQSIGAMPFSIDEINPDALVCGGYKWLMGAYGLGLAYIGERFHQGRPLENNWINHEGSEDFTNLVNYNENFKPFAARFDVGESSNFILTPMLSEAINQINQWTPKSIQEYCASITNNGVTELKERGYFVEEVSNRGHHLFGIYPPTHIDIQKIKQRISSKNIYVSYRGKAIRVSPNIYNSKDEIDQLVSCFL